MKISLPGRRSRNLEDRRGQSAGGMGGFGRGGGMPIPMGLGAGGGITGILIVIAFVVLTTCLSSGGGGFGIDPPLDNAPGVQPGGSAPPVPASEEEEALVDFVSFVLDDVQIMWDDLFTEANRDYEEAQLVLFTDGVNTACGGASSDTGPFYCPADETAYLDLSFFRELHERFGAPGDFAQAYVIAHEIAHHVQNQLGISTEVRQRQIDDPDVANELSVRLELQADCFAGVWGRSTYEREILESGDLEEGLTAAAAIGDDRLQRQAGGRVNPDSFTHGTSEQRVEWFRRGFDTGEPSDCDTFNRDIG